MDRKRRKQLLEKLSKLMKGDLRDLDYRKLVNSKDLYRLRVGKIRIILKQKYDILEVVDIDFRGGIYK